MITLQHHSPRYIALRNCYAQRDAIKALADYPDVPSGAFQLVRDLGEGLAAPAQVASRERIAEMLG